jgi:hypothetical protein
MATLGRMSDPENHQAVGDLPPIEVFSAAMSLMNGESQVLSMSVKGERYEVQRTLIAALRGFSEAGEDDRIERVFRLFADIALPILTASGLLKQDAPPASRPPPGSWDVGGVATPPPDQVRFWRPGTYPTTPPATTEPSDPSVTASNPSGT